MRASLTTASLCACKCVLDWEAEALAVPDSLFCHRKQSRAINSAGGQPPAVVPIDHLSKKMIPLKSSVRSVKKNKQVPPVGKQGRAAAHHAAVRQPRAAGAEDEKGKGRCLAVGKENGMEGDWLSSAEGRRLRSPNTIRRVSIKVAADPIAEANRRRCLSQQPKLQQVQHVYAIQSGFKATRRLHLLLRAQNKSRAQHISGAGRPGERLQAQGFQCALLLE